MCDGKCLIAKCHHVARDAVCVEEAVWSVGCKELEAADSVKGIGGMCYDGVEVPFRTAADLG